MILLDDAQIATLQRESAIVSSLSLAGSLAIIATHISYRQLRSRSAKLVVYLSLSVAGSDLTGLAFLSGGSCTLYGLFTSFFLISIALWSATISRTLQLVVMHRSQLSRSLTRLNSMVYETRFKTSLELLRMAAFHIVVWGVSLMCALGIVIFSTSAPISSWCWFSKSPDAAASTGQLLFFYVPILLALLYNSYVLCGTYLQSCLARRGSGGPFEAPDMQDGLSSDLTALSDSLRYYVLFTIVVLALVCLAELVNLAAFPRYKDSSPQHFWLYFAIFLLARLQGVFNLFVYARRADVRAAWSDTLWHSVLRRPREPIGSEALIDVENEFQSTTAGNRLLVATPSPYHTGFSAVASTESTPRYQFWGSSIWSSPPTPLASGSAT